MKTQKGKYIKFGKPFSVTVSKGTGKTRLEWQPDAIYITHDRFKIYLDYAGEHSGESAAKFTLPADEDFLRRLAAAFQELADEYPDRKD